jgi:hypothetical protein
VLDLSQSGLTLGLNYLENVENGYSTALAAEKGVVLWRVAHDGETAKLEVSGNPPKDLGDIRDQVARKEKENPNINYALDIPTELAKVVTGYRLDHEDIPFKGLRFGPPTQTSQVPTTGRGILSALFGFHLKPPPKKREL